MGFKDNLIKIRKELDLTQKTLAGKVGIHISNIRRYEKGSTLPTIDVLAKLAKTLGVSTDELLFNSNNGVASYKIMDKDLLKSFEEVSKLDNEDIKAVKILLESIIVRNQVNRLAKK